MEITEEEQKHRKLGIIIGLSIVAILFIWIAVSLSRLAGQSEEGTEVYVHNPYDSLLKLKIGKKSYDLGPRRTKIIKVSEGKTRLKSSLHGSTLVDTSIEISSSFLNKGGVINLSDHPMYRWTEMYGSAGLEKIYDIGDSSTRAASPISQKVSQSAQYFVIDSTLLYGIVKMYPADQILVSKDWNYNLDEYFESEVSSSNQAEMVLGTSRSKIFNKSGMLRYWNKNYAALFQQLRILESLERTKSEQDSIVGNF